MTKRESDLFAKSPKGMRFQPRDGDILQAIDDFDGVLSRKQIHALFWPDKSTRSMERRLAKLQQAGYLAWPDPKDYKTKPIPEPICWIGWRGALTLAGLQGIRVPPPKGENEFQLRKLENDLRKAGYRWVRTPRWSLLSHDLAVNDFRISALKSLEQMQRISMHRWINESYFRANLEVVEYSIKLRNKTTKELKKGVCPDGYFEILDEERQQEGKNHIGRFFLEMDMSTHDNPSFGREKAAAGAAYVRNQMRENPHIDRMVWLIVTNGGKKRHNNLMRQTRTYAGKQAEMFYFTNVQMLKEGNVFLDPIWSHVDVAHKISIF